MPSRSLIGTLRCVNAYYQFACSFCFFFFPKNYIRTEFIPHILHSTRCWLTGIFCLTIISESLASSLIFPRDRWFDPCKNPKTSEPNWDSSLLPPTWLHLSQLSCIFRFDTHQLRNDTMLLATPLPFPLRACIIFSSRGPSFYPADCSFAYFGVPAYFICSPLDINACDCCQPTIE